ncbi:rhodanese-related sulfurtransferase [Buchnera aphidicola (Thelaxes californica)]|uniref:tRNA uridine(34) hydroxylase n=1 Tax=Buchnera aphidicola (Thelaxes californica) TaxID=1315998 RepID=A0A4D6YFE5_9GAMM|nr:rhodanese-related sulfurtransferase [Buchnera aphidicola]QCI26813.1 rhodanese-related sulfurtransferase [Buchnera aphidicola (Thelaxes californica)]
MIILHNTIPKKILKKKILNQYNNYIIVSFYKYFFIKDVGITRDILYLFFSTINVLGRVYISSEGINAQVSVPNKNYFIMKNFIRNLHDNLKNLNFNEALENKPNAFFLLIVKVKKKIVQDNLQHNFFDSTKLKNYLNAIQVNCMINDPDTIFVDVRNDYEFQIGHFNNALHISSNTFSETMKNIVSQLKRFQEKNIVLYCTGGIRCEKAASWLLFNKFKKIYQVKNGIIGYVHDARKKNIEVHFKGANFVFDARMIEHVSYDTLGQCRHCKKKCDNYINCKNSICNNLFIQCMNCNIQYKNYCSKKCVSSF